MAIAGLSEVEINSLESALNYIATAKSNRTTAFTAMNAGDMKELQSTSQRVLVPTA